MTRIIPSVLFLLLVAGFGAEPATPPVRTASRPFVFPCADCLTIANDHETGWVGAISTVVPRNPRPAPYAIIGVAALAAYAGLCVARVMNADPAPRR
jgi:hypothetical protein